MAKMLDPKIVEVLKLYGFDQSACWDSYGTWVVYHRILEQIAAKAGILYREPTVLVAEKDAAAILVTGQLGDKTEWSIGEAVIGTNYKVSGKQAAYPFAMAEKRAKDRVILKLIGLHGLAYSEEEADDFRAPSSVGTERRVPNPEVAGSSPAERASIDNEEAETYLTLAKTTLQNAEDSEEIDAWLKDEAGKRTSYGIVKGTDYFDRLGDMVAQRRAELAGGQYLMAG